MDKMECIGTRLLGRKCFQSEEQITKRIRAFVTALVWRAMVYKEDRRL